MKIRVGFIISDKIYIERLVSTLNRYYSDKLEIYSYTDVKVANESVENQRLDIVIVDETLQVNEYRNCCMAYFVESPDIDKIEGKKAICKFQKVELIYKDILALYSEYSSRITKRKRSGELAEVITFTSPACGSGVTSMAAAFALNCSLNNKSALYLSMENIPTTDIIFDGEGKYTLTDVVYAVKSKRSNLSMKLESFAITDSANVDYFAAPKNPMDLHEMNDEDVELLISELKSMGLYDFIVIDADFNITPTFKKIIVGKLWISKAGTPSSVNKYYIGLSSTEGNDGIVKNLATGTGGYNEKKVAKDVKSFEKDKKYYIKWSKVENQKQEVANKLAELETALDNADKAVSKYADKNYGTGDDQANKAQWYYFAYNAAKDSIKDVNSKGDALAKAWVTYTAMLDCEADPDDSTFPSDWKKDERAYSDEIKADVHTIFNGDFPDSGLNGHGGKYMTVKNALVDIYNGGVLSEYDTSGVSSKLNDIATNLAAYREKIQSYIDALSLVIEGDGNKHKITKKHELLSLDELSDLVWEYYSDYNDWKGNATESKTSLGTEQRTEVGTYEKEKRDVDGDDVVEFKNKLIKEREALQSIVDAIDSIKYGSKKLTDIKNFDTFYSQFKNKFTNPTEPIRNSRIDIDGHDIYYKLLTPQKTEALIPVPECKLILEKGDDTYYDFLLTRGYESDGKSLKDLKKDVDEKDGKIDDFKKQKEDAENSEDTKKDKSGSDEIKNSSNVNVGEYEGSKFGAGTLLKGFAQTIENFANQKGPNVRDSLYATLYTMNMFSYRTYVYEGKYDDYTDSYGDEITYENCEEKYKTVSSNWADEKATYTYNKSLTNHMINNANNAAFNAEVEYVLYGSTNEENLKSAYANIYEIRLALNLASGYLNFWSAGKNTTADVINGAADLIAEITRHIIPAPVTKAVLIALLAALESIQDMKILNKGIPLEVYKVSDEQWSYSINKKGDSKDDVGISDPKSPKKGEGICMQYSDYLFIFLYSMFQSGDDKTNKAYCRLGRLIEANMQKVDKDHPQFSLKQSKTLFTLTSEIDVSPLMMDQPLASDYKDSLADGSWNRYTIEVTRGY